MHGGDWKEMFYAVQDGDLELIRVHLKQGIDPNFQHPEVLCLPLVESARLGLVEIAKLLLEYGADPELKAAWEGRNALETALIYHQREVEDLLRAHLGLPPRPRGLWQRVVAWVCIRNSS